MTLRVGPALPVLLALLAGTGHTEETARQPAAPEATPAERRVTELGDALREAVRRRDVARVDSTRAALLGVTDSLEAAGEPGPASLGLQLCGWSDVRRGRLDAALSLYARAESLAIVTGDSTQIAEALNTAAIAMAIASRYEDAIDHWERALAIHRTRGDRHREGQLLGNLANAYNLAGRTLEARRITEQAMVVDRETGNETGLAAAHHRLASILRELRRFDAALAHADTAVELQTRLDLDPSIAVARRSQIRFDAGDYEEALRDLDAADSMAIAHGDHRQAHSNRGNRVKMLVALGRPHDALEVCESVDVEAMAPVARVLFESYRGLALLGTGEPDGAERTLADALERFERLGRDEAGALGPEGAALHDRAGEVFAALATVRILLGRPEDAWTTVEQASSVGLRARLGAEAIDLATTRHALAASGSAALVQFGEKGWGPTPVFVVTADTLIARESEVPRGDDLASARELLASGADDATCRPALERISAPLLTGLAEAVDGVDRLYIVPPSSLTGFPLEALPLPGDPEGRTLGDRWAVSYLAGAWMLPVLSAREVTGRTMVLFADPGPSGTVADGTRRTHGPLPHARREARAIAVRDATVLLGPEASAEAFRSRTRTGAVLHFATHAVLDPLRPERSGLVLAGADSVVTATDVEALALRADLVTLSGCRTAGGWTTVGEGTIGLPRAFLAAGTRSVVSSFWDVEDEAAARFMERFYRELRAGAPRDQALRAARMSLALAGYPPRDRVAFALTGIGHEPVPAIAGAAPLLSSPWITSGPILALVVAGLVVLALILRARLRS